ncbi:MAG: RES family NAD+ phosphorylase [Polyangiaceae bacterium]|nr:RES family NAD+ phosphorylase [Polyangiaceae bacterium]
MTNHPNPPADFARRKLPLVRLRGTFYRIHRAHRAALYFGKAGTYRFDAPSKEFGVLYAGRDMYCAFIETFGHATGVRFVDATELAARALAEIRVRRPLRFVDLRASGLARVGADAELTSGTDYALAHRWSLAFYRHPQKPDGIAYRARHDPSRVSVAIFDRAKSLLRVKSRTRLDANADKLADLLDTYDFGLV